MITEIRLTKECMAEFLGAIGADARMRERVLSGALALDLSRVRARVIEDSTAPPGSMTAAARELAAKLPGATVPRDAGDAVADALASQLGSGR